MTIEKYEIKHRWTGDVVATAAPDLLAALEGLLFAEGGEAYNAAIDAARAAIAKARGTEAAGRAAVG